MDTALASLDELLGLKVDRLDSYDVLALSFYAGRGLPGTEKSKLEHWYSKRDAWVYRIQFEIARHLYRFDAKAGPPTETFYGNSLGRFICYMTLQVLQEDCGVKYHPWPEEWNAFEIEHGYYLRSQSARQAFAAMLFERGECFWDFRMIGEALKSYHFARQFVPDDERYKRHHEARFKEYEYNRIMFQEHQREQRLRLEMASTNPLGHQSGCRCLQCEYQAGRSGGRRHIPPHGQSCQCFECRKVRAAAKPAGLPGHPQPCYCAGCRRSQNSHVPTFPGVPGLNPFF